jgi:hypothetical protein
MWYEAEFMFLKAIELDSRHVLANYNLACVLSLQYYNGEANHPPLLESSESVPYYYLYQSVVYDPSRMKRARDDSDLINIREVDPILFDAVTLPVNERKRVVQDVIFEEAVGKTFRIVTVSLPVEAEFVGGTMLSKGSKIISLEPISE